MEAKLKEAKAEIQSMMVRSCWRKEWRDAIDKWSEQITIDTNGCAVLPRSYDDGHSPQIDTISNLKREYNLSSFLGYQLRQLSGKMLVPTNLMADVYRHFVIALGGNFSAENSRELQGGGYYYNPDSYWWQLLYNGEENKRHHKIIHESLLKASSSSRATSTVSASSANDNWEKVRVQRIQFGGKLLAIHYVGEVVEHLKRHQVSRMIEHHFHSRGPKMIENAKRFEGCLSLNSMGAVDLLVGPHYRSLIDVASLGKNCLGDVRRKAMKTFNLEDENGEHCRRHHWRELSKDPHFLAKLNETKSEIESEKSVSLTAADVQFIICCRIDAECDEKEWIAKIKLLTSTFPTSDDDFSNFDPPHLRGLFAKTALSKKLAEYAVGKEEIYAKNAGSFAAIAPLALTEIVMDYYPIDILNT